MRNLFSFCLCLVLFLIPFAITTNVEEVSIDDLLNPESNLTNEKVDINYEIAQEPKQEVPMWDKLLGPEDNFPFLPDNHRDSGTGKFNAFN